MKINGDHNDRLVELIVRRTITTIRVSFSPKQNINNYLPDLFLWNEKLQVNLNLYPTKRNGYF